MNKYILLALLVASPLAARAPDAPLTAVVSAADPRAAEAGVAMLRAGGSAADAAAATMLALTVVEPQSSGIGGGGLLLFQPPKGKLVALDGREIAPAVATPRQFIGPDGKPLGGNDAQTGGLSVGVPGNIALIAELHRRGGRLPWAALFEPAIKLSQGFTTSGRLAQFSGYTSSGLSFGAGGAASLYMKDGKPLPAGTLFANPALEATLRALAAGGPQAFYAGPIGAQVVAVVNGAAARPTAMTMADLAAYRVRERAAVCGTYRSYKICGMGPPGSGGIGVLQMLKQIEGHDLAKLGQNNPVTWHLFAESQRLAFADRDMWVGDADFVKVPVAGLISPAYVRARGRLIRTDARMATVAAGMPAGAPKRIAANDNDVPGTSHFSVADARGGVVTYTSTVERPFGSGLLAGGFVLNNELTDFNFVPVKDGALTANAVAPGKRPRSSMSPTLVYDRRGKVVLAIGAAGGSTILAQVAKAIIGVVDFKLPVEQAIALPQVYAIGDRFAVEAGSNLEAMIPAFTALGHKPTSSSLPLKANGVERAGAGWRGGADPRSEGQAAGL
ncbi:gamma-glutamyltransferase family protein [Glacieibacterium frigidum]|uniref:Gamma-glutamyltransferase family protein n=1 Tax=Glacieibacterium frigidum TaxID=2593303 RepID=A0A552U8Y3_9SPHN|nr:gamma-glutamyltransferase family protein [Glacieibacterium frigidum]TRW14672.1 gamma-glutamyltransferase family protein [Glacieibacterium frigidum]